jgi:hypothetical protein
MSVKDWNAEHRLGTNSIFFEKFPLQSSAIPSDSSPCGEGGGTKHQPLMSLPSFSYAAWLPVAPSRPQSCLVAVKNFLFRNPSGTGTRISFPAFLLSL